MCLGLSPSRTDGRRGFTPLRPRRSSLVAFSRGIVRLERCIRARPTTLQSSTFSNELGLRPARPWTADRDCFRAFPVKRTPFGRPERLPPMNALLAPSVVPRLGRRDPRHDTFRVRAIHSSHPSFASPPGVQKSDLRSARRTLLRSRCRSPTSATRHSPRARPRACDLHHAKRGERRKLSPPTAEVVLHEESR